MAGLGALTSVGKYGIGASMLAAAFGDAFGAGDNTPWGFADNALSSDTLKWVLSWFIEEEDIENSAIFKMLDGNEGPINALLGSMLILPEGGIKKAGIYASLGWLALKMYQAYQDNKLTSVFNTSGNTDTASPEAAAQAEVTVPAYSHEAAKAAMDRFLENSVAQVAGQNLTVTENGVVDADADQGLDPDEFDPRNE